MLDLRRPAAADSERSEEAHEGAPGDGATTVEPEGDFDAVETLAVALARFVRDGGYSSEEFRRFERHGVHVTPVHFYSPIPDTAHLATTSGARIRPSGVDMNDESSCTLLLNLPAVPRRIRSPCGRRSEDPSTFHFDNGFFDGTDALVLYCMLRHLKPRRVIEVGSGFPPARRTSGACKRLN